MKIYIAGPMTGLPEYNHPAFHAMEEALVAAGMEAVNPAKLNPIADGEAHWRECMKVNIPALLDCAAITALPGWEKSRGATIEMIVARVLGMKFVGFTEGSVSFWLEVKNWPMKLLASAIAMHVTKKS